VSIQIRDFGSRPAYWWVAVPVAHIMLIGAPTGILHSTFLSLVRPLPDRRTRSARRSRPDRVWNRIPGEVRDKSLDLVLEVSELSPRERSKRFTDEKKYFSSESSVYWLLKAHDLIISPAYIIIYAAYEFKDETKAPNQIRKTDFTYFKIVG